MCTFNEDGTIFVSDEPGFCLSAEDSLFASKWLYEREPEASWKDWVKAV